MAPFGPSFFPQPGVFSQPLDFSRHCPPRWPFVFSRLRTLFLSLRSFSHPDPLFSIACGVFCKNTRGGIPLQHFADCTEVQKRHFLSSLSAALTHTLSRKSFPCHSYANTRDTGATPPGFFPPLATRHSPLPPDRSSISFRINTCKSVSKQTTLTSFRINTCEKPGGGGVTTWPAKTSYG